jgi:phenylacetate-CoA ligase
MAQSTASEKAVGEFPEFRTIREVFDKVKSNKFYGKKFEGLSLNTWDDFFKLPTTTKEEMRACDPEDILAVPISEVWRYHESFGTTGKPAVTWFTRGDYDREVELTSRWAAPIKPGVRVLNRLLYSFSVPPMVVELKARHDGGVMIPADNMTWNVSYARTLELIYRLKVDVIACLPVEVIILALLAEKCGYDLARDLGSLKHLMLAGRVVPLALKEYLEKLWNAAATSVYGLTETGGIASMCESWRLHIHPRAFILEIVDPETGRHVPDGEVGVLLVTSYYRQASPLFRFNTEDYSRMYTDACPCGDPSPTIEILGRVDDTIEMEGKRIYFKQLEEAVLRFAQQFESVIYFAVVTGRRLLIRIESENGKSWPSGESLQRLREALRVPLKVSICKKGELLDRDQLLRFPNVFKPHNLSDWRKGKRRCVTLSEALIEWPKLGFGDLLDIARRAVKNQLLRWTLR